MVLSLHRTISTAIEAVDDNQVNNLACDVSYLRFQTSILVTNNLHPPSSSPYRDPGFPVPGTDRQGPQKWSLGMDSRNGLSAVVSGLMLSSHWNTSNLRRCWTAVAEKSEKKILERQYKEVEESLRLVKEIVNETVLPVPNRECLTSCRRMRGLLIGRPQDRQHHFTVPLSQADQTEGSPTTTLSYWLRDLLASDPCLLPWSPHFPKSSRVLVQLSLHVRLKMPR